MILIDGSYVAANTIARVTPHPAVDCICVILLCGKELRVPVPKTMAKEQVAKNIAQTVLDSLREDRGVT